MEKPKCIIIIRFTNKNVFFLEDLSEIAIGLL